MMVIKNSSRLGSIYTLRRRPVIGHVANTAGAPRFGLPTSPKMEVRADGRAVKRHDIQKYWVSVHKAEKAHKTSFGW